MNYRSIWEKIAGHPAPAVSVVVALIAAGVLWYDAGTGDALTATRDSLKARSDRMADNRRHARNLEADVSRAAGLARRIGALALDFDSPAATAEFSARLAQGGAVIVDGLPAEQGKSVPTAAKPYATTGYTMSASGDFPTLLAFLTELANDPARSLVVTRARLASDDSTPKTGRIRADIGFLVWGVANAGRNASPAVASADKSVAAPEARAKRMEAAEALLAPVRTDLASAVNPFGDTMSVAVVDAPGAVELESALRNLDYTIGSIDGNPVVKLPGILPRRVGGEIEIAAGGRVHRARIVRIGTDDFSVVSSAGKEIRIYPRK